VTTDISTPQQRDEQRFGLIEELLLSVWEDTEIIATTDDLRNAIVAIDPFTAFFNCDCCSDEKRSVFLPAVEDFAKRYKAVQR